MPYIIKRLGTMPAVIIRFVGKHNGDHGPAIERQLTNMFADVSGPIWRILDVTDFHFTFAGMWEAIAHSRHRTRWTVSDSQVRTVVVTNSDIAFLGVRVLEQLNPGVKIQLFRTIAEALAYVRGEIEASQVEIVRVSN